MDFKINTYIRPVLMISAIIGGFLGLLLLIPIVNFFVIIFFGLIGGLTIYILKRKTLVGILTLNDGAIIGAIAGFISSFAASVIYIPLAFILGNFFPMFTIGFSMNVPFWVASFNIFVVFMIISFIGFLNAIFCSFSGIIAAFIYEQIEKNVEHPEFRIDITDK